MSRVLFFGCKPVDVSEFTDSGIFIEWPDITSRHGIDKTMAEGLANRIRKGTFNALVLWTGNVSHSAGDHVCNAANFAEIPIYRRKSPSRREMELLHLDLCKLLETATTVVDPNIKHPLEDVLE